MSENTKSRLAAYKNHSKNSQEMRQRRLEVTVELRKSKKDEQMLKRRNIDDIELPTSPLQEQNGQSPPASMTLEEIVVAIQSDDINMQFRATQATRKILSCEKNPPIDLIISQGIVPICVSFLDYFEYPDLQFEAAWTLTNLGSGTAEQTNCVIEAGAIPKLVNLLGVPSNNVADQAVWALGNIAGDGARPRDLVLNSNVVDKLLALLARDLPLAFLKNTFWMMSNLCRNKNPRPPFDKIKPMLPAFAQYLMHPNSNIVSDVCWALSYISDESDQKIQALLDSGMLPPLIACLESSHQVVVTPALRTVGNIVTGNDYQTDQVIAANALVALKKLLTGKNKNIVKEATWTISNIAAGNRSQIQALIDHGIYVDIINILRFGDFRAQREAAWAITNTTTSASDNQLPYLIELGVLKPFCDLLESKDLRIVKIVLSGITNMFKFFEKANNIENFCCMVEECRGLDKLEELQQHENEEIYFSAYNIVDTYFGGQEQIDVVGGPQEQNGEFAGQTNGEKANGNGGNQFSF